MPEFSASDKEEHDRLVIDMWFGTDKNNPPITIRMDRVERLIEQISGVVKWLCAAIGTLILTAAGDLIVRIAGVHFK